MTNLSESLCKEKTDYTEIINDSNRIYGNFISNMFTTNYLELFLSEIIICHVENITIKGLFHFY